MQDGPSASMGEPEYLRLVDQIHLEIGQFENILFPVLSDNDELRKAEIGTVPSAPKVVNSLKLILERIQGLKKRIVL